MEQSSERLPLVSIVIPVYNMEEYLEETLCSVLASTYPHIEVILMDDGSKDSSLCIAEKFAAQYENVYAYSQPNGGASNARNNALKLAHGVYVVPVDADNRISSGFISQSVTAIEGHPEIKAIFPSAEFIGDRTGLWKLPPFSLSLLARKNMLDTCALYRFTEWERVGGYREDVGREDWVFWIAVLKDGGEIVRLPEVGLYYRIRSGSKRGRDRLLLRHTIDVLNQLYPEFFRRELGGPLRYRRTWSKLINTISSWIHGGTVQVHPDYKELESFVLRLPEQFAKVGTVIYKGRNELRLYQEQGYELVVKSFRRPNIVNRIAYSFLRTSKAERAYRYALLFLKAGISTPMPVGFISRKRWFLFDDSYFVCLKSTCPCLYKDFLTKTFSRQEEILQAIGRTTARIHESRFLPQDYSRGNILFDPEAVQIPVEIVDLNRMDFGKVSLDKGCKNFERLPGTDEMLETMGSVYAEERGFDPAVCIEKIKNYVRVEREMRLKKENRKSIEG